MFVQNCTSSHINGYYYCYCYSGHMWLIAVVMVFAWDAVHAGSLGKKANALQRLFGRQPTCPIPSLVMDLCYDEDLNIGLACEAVYEAIDAIKYYACCYLVQDIMSFLPLREFSLCSDYECY